MNLYVRSHVANSCQIHVLAIIAMKCVFQKERAHEGKFMCQQVFDFKRVRAHFFLAEEMHLSIIRQQTYKKCRGWMVNSIVEDTHKTIKKSFTMAGGRNFR